MASRQVLLLAAAAVAVAFLPALTSAADYIVGGDAGWTLKYPKGWPDDKTFKVGDNLVFTYPKGEHTVVEVDGQTFKDCNRQGNTLEPWVSGNDTVKLDKAVKRWFFCGTADHCEKGLKLAVEVVDDGPKAPASPPASPPTSSAALSYKVGGAVAQAMVAAGAVVAAVFM